MDDNNVSSDMETNDSSSEAMTTSSEAAVSSAAPSTKTRVINMTVQSFSFTPNSVVVKQGEKVVIHLTGTSGAHSFSSRELGIDVPISEGETKDIEIPTGTKGTFSFRCGIPCGSGHMNMKGTIVVE